MWNLILCICVLGSVFVWGTCLVGCYNQINAVETGFNLKCMCVIILYLSMCMHSICTFMCTHCVQCVTLYLEVVA